MSKEEQKLRECPFCRSENVHQGYDLISDPIVYCATCGANSGPYNTPQQAVAAWNTRPQPAIEGDVVGKVEAEVVKWLWDRNANTKYLAKAAIAAMQSNIVIPILDNYERGKLGMEVLTDEVEAEVSLGESAGLTDKGYKGNNDKFREALSIAWEEASKEYDYERGKLDAIKERLILADGWEDGETFYKSTVEAIREIIEQGGGDA